MQFFQWKSLLKPTCTFHNLYFLFYCLISLLRAISQKKKEINWRRRLTTKEILKKFCRICRKNNRVCAISHCTQSKKINIKHIWYWHTKICRFEPFFFCSLSHYFTLSRKNKKINPVLISQKDFYNNKKIAHRTRHLMWNAANAKSCLLATTVYSNEASQFLFKYFVFNFLRILLLRLYYYLQWQVTTFKKNL